MTDPGGPQRGRHSSPAGAVGTGFDVPARAARDLPGGDAPGYGVPRYEPARYEPPTWGGELPAHPFDATGRATSDRPAPGVRGVSGLLDRFPGTTGPVAPPEWWSYGSTDHPSHPLTARHSRRDDEEPQVHPSAPLPPRPPGVWDRLHPRQDGDDAQTVAQPLLPRTPLDRTRRGEQTSGPVGGSPAGDDESTEAHPLHPAADDAGAWDEETGGLDVIGAHVEEDAPRRRGLRGRRAAAADSHDLDDRDSVGDLLHDGDDARVHDEASGDLIPVKPYDRRAGRGRRRRRSPLAVVFSLLVLAGLVVGIVLGGQKLLALFNPTAQDYTGQGTGAIQIRVQDGDTLSDIARTLEGADVIASTGPFVDAADTNAAAVGIQPGVYDMRLQMSGQAALDLLLDPASRLLSRVTLPEGLTVQRTLARIAEETGRPVEEFQAAAADTAALGVPANSVIAWLGPAIGPQAFEVGDDVRAAFMAQAAIAADAFRRHGDRWHADLYRLAHQRLAALGVTQIHGGGLCTYSDSARFYSYRRDGVTGRMATLIWMDPP
mgnify:CR=1 FL=1